MEEHIIIGSDRHITVPETLKKIAVQFDHNAETVTFDCPRYWDEHDLSKMAIYVNYMRPDETVGAHLCDNVVIDRADNDIMHFDWTISGHVTEMAGPLSFLVCIRDVDSEGNEKAHWNTELNTDMYISSGMRCRESILRKYPDIITQLLVRMDQSEAIVAAAKESAGIAAASAESAKSSAAAAEASSVTSTTSANAAQASATSATSSASAAKTSETNASTSASNAASSASAAKASETNAAASASNAAKSETAAKAAQSAAEAAADQLANVSTAPSDWSQNDSTQPGYVQNRTHYVAKRHDFSYSGPYTWVELDVTSAEYAGGMRYYANLGLFEDEVFGSGLVPSLCDFNNVRGSNLLEIPANTITSESGINFLWNAVRAYNNYCEIRLYRGVGGSDFAPTMFNFSTVKQLSDAYIPNTIARSHAIARMLQLNGDGELILHDDNTHGNTGIILAPDRIGLYEDVDLYDGLTITAGYYGGDVPTLEFWGSRDDENVRLRCVESPEQDNDAANKAYVDNAVASATGGSGITIQATAPEDTSMPWLDTSTGVLKYHNGTTWIGTKATWG